MSRTLRLIRFHSIRSIDSSTLRGISFHRFLLDCRTTNLRATLMQPMSFRIEQRRLPPLMDRLLPSTTSLVSPCQYLSPPRPSECTVVGGGMRQLTQRYEWSGLSFADVDVRVIMNNTLTNDLGSCGLIPCTKLLDHKLASCTFGCQTSKVPRRKPMTQAHNSSFG